MKDILNFLVEVGKLKRIPRTGWVLIGIEEPETIAAHTFHATIMAWILARKRKNNLNVDRIVKIALIHDLCELYAGDITPYNGILPRDKKKWPELFDKWPRASEKKKIKIFLKKHKKERKSLEKLVSKLPSETKKEILNLWFDYELGLTKEGRFTKQAGRLTTLLQALLYGSETKRRVYRSWWVGTKEKIDDPLLIDFIKALEKKFHHQKITKKLKPLMILLNFFSEVGKLKNIKRKGIMFYGVKNPETTAEHTFRMTLLTWILGRMDKNLNIEKVIKMSLAHDLCEVYAGSITPYDGLLPKDKKKRYQFVREWPPRVRVKEKEKIYKQKLKKEKRSLEKLIKKLPQKFKKEIFNLWWDYEKGGSKEGKFVRQIDRAENLLEALDCWQKDKSFPTKPWWQHAEEVIDNPIILKFLEEISKKELKNK